MTQLRLDDRLDGSRLPAADDKPLVEGRYSVTETIDYGGHSRLEPGDPLLDDGTPSPTLGHGQVQFQRPGLAETDLDDLAVAFDALAAIDAKSDLAAGRWPSPLLPSELGRKSDITDLERLLTEVFERGHLDAIATRPRLSMRYETEVLAVGRAHRLDSAFQRHLSAHSECWAARTLSGVVPKAVLARVSEDDANIYEHRVYARLLDHLDRYLHQRIAKLTNIGQRYTKALAFQDSETVDYRLRNAICGVWGEAVTGNDASQLLVRNEERLKTLMRWSKRIRGLKMKRVQSLEKGSLYATISRGAEVGLSLVPTNLLTRDSHYRQLRLLWRSWLQATAGEREHPVQVLERRLREQARYERYIGLLLVRALRALGFDMKMANARSGEARNAHWEEQITIGFSAHAWSLGIGTRRLVLVPAAVALDTDTAEQWRTHLLNEGKELRVPCVLRLGVKPEDEVPPFESVADNALALQLTPLDLYAEEAMVTLISSWLWQWRLEGYGELFPRLPQAVLAAWPESSAARSNDRSLRQPITDEQWHRLTKALEQHVHSNLRGRITARKRQIDHLACCPECGKPAALFQPENDGFFARCHCDCEWHFRNRRFTQTRGGDSPHSNFETLGRRWLEVQTRDELEIK